MFAISWGGFLLTGGSGLFAGTPWQTDPRFQTAVLAMLAGPPIAGILMTIFVSATAQQTAYRVLMVVIYARTESLFLVILMHASLIFSTLFVLAPPTTGGPLLTYSWAFTAALWIVVAVVGAVNRRHLERSIEA